LGPSTQKQADASRRSLEGSASEFNSTQGNTANGSTSGSESTGWQSDGGRAPREKQHGLDVIR